MMARDPRRVGGRYYCGYWQDEYTVTAIDAETPCGSPGPWFTVVWSDGHSTTHCTAWDAKQDRVVRPVPQRLDGCTCGGIGDTGAHSHGCGWALR